MNCFNCRFFKKTHEGGGTCLRFPPQLVTRPLSNNEGFDYLSEFPSVMGQEWCGEWIIDSENDQPV